MTIKRKDMVAAGRARFTALRAEMEATQGNILCPSPKPKSSWRRSGGTPPDWTVRESVRAGMRNAVRRVLRKQGCPQDKEEKAIETVIEQAELLSEEWANPQLFTI